MNKKKLDQIRRELVQARRSPQGRKAAFFQGFAQALGRNLDNRGKEPTWVRAREPALSPPMAIPNHSKDMKVGTAKNIIDMLLADCDDWDQFLLLTEDEEEIND